MYEYIKGTLVDLSPTEVVVDNNGIGYKILISLQTYSKLIRDSDIKLFIYHHLREDTELLFGFIDKDERYIFLNLISVSGIGPNTARMMLSSMTSEEIRIAIISGDVNKLKGIKGVGIKTAQRLLVELKDKIGKGSSDDFNSILFNTEQSEIKSEASTALILLGFTRTNVEKAIDAVLKENQSVSLEALIKQALKRL
jgi:Holliday junction DNA helicase RuvA